MKIIYIKNCSKIRYYYFRAQINKRISIKFAICAVQSTSTSAQLIIMKSFLFDFTDKVLPEETKPMRTVRRICFPFILLVIILYHGFLLCMKTTKLTGSDHQAPVVTQSYALGFEGRRGEEKENTIVHPFFPD